MKARILKSRRINQAGFSLIELMIVVAIIGILATIAVPNFQRFQAKARQSEIKTNLSALYGAEKAFHAEWNMFYGDFRDIGLLPEGQLRYHFGFAAAGAAPAAPFNGSTTGGAAGSAFNTSIVAARAPGSTLATGIPAYSAATAAGACPAGANPNGLVGSAALFVASGVGNPGSTATADRWTINQAKLLCNNVSGI